MIQGDNGCMTKVDELVEATTATILLKSATKIFVITLEELKPTT